MLSIKNISDVLYKIIIYYLKIFIETVDRLIFLWYNINIELAFKTLKKFVQENDILDIKDYNEREFEVYMSY